MTGRTLGFAGGPRAVARLVSGLAWWAACAAVVALAVAAWPQQYGGATAVVIVSGQSMEPTYAGGDLLVTRPGAYARGDVVVYTVPDGEPGAGGRVVHRLVGGSDAQGWVAQGDNNDAPDLWRPRDHDIHGRVVVHVPMLGLLLVQLRSPLTWALLGGLYVGYLMWPRDEAEAGAAEPAQPPDAAEPADPAHAPEPTDAERAGAALAR